MNVSATFGTWFFAMLTAGLLTGSPASASPATDAFASLKALAGTWDVSDASGPLGQATYEVVADGSVVLEHLMGMVTTYYLDGDHLLAVHYCSAHNVPRLRAEAALGAGEAHFSVVDVGNLPDPHAGFMAKLDVAFFGADRFRQAWTWRQDGTDSTPAVFMFKRHL